MTEREYIDATDLAKLRAAYQIVANTIGDKDKLQEAELRRTALAAIDSWCSILEKRVKTKD